MTANIRRELGVGRTGERVIAVIAFKFDRQAVRKQITDGAHRNGTGFDLAWALDPNWYLVPRETELVDVFIQQPVRACARADVEAA